MKYVDEFRDPELAKRVAEEIAEVSGGRVVCKKASIRS